MKRARTLVARAVVGALLLVSLNVAIASADPGTGAPADPNAFPQDPGVGADAFPQDPGLD